MPLPAFRDDGWLPEGHHLAIWEEIIARSGDVPGSQQARPFPACRPGIMPFEPGCPRWALESMAA